MAGLQGKKEKPIKIDDWGYPIYGKPHLASGNIDVNTPILFLGTLVVPS